MPIRWCFQMFQSSRCYDTSKDDSPYDLGNQLINKQTYASLLTIVHNLPGTVGHSLSARVSRATLAWKPALHFTCPSIREEVSNLWTHNNNYLDLYDLKRLTKIRSMHRLLVMRVNSSTFAAINIDRNRKSTG